MPDGKIRVRFRLLAAFLALCAFLIADLAMTAPAAGGSQTPQAGVSEDEKRQRPAFVPGELIVKYKPQVAIAAARQTEDRHGLKRIKKLAVDNYSLLTVPPGKDVAQAAALLRQDPAVESVEPNAVRSISLTPDDPQYHLQWNFYQVQAQEAWTVSRGAGVVVAVLDTGVAYEDYERFRLAPDLAQTRFVPGRDFIENDDHPNDDHGHGTHVAGTIAQSTDNGAGVAGLAFEASIMPVKVMDAEGHGSCALSAEGIEWAVDNGAKVINLSFGGSTSCEVERVALAHAAARGVTVVAAAGNVKDSEGTVDFPAANESVIAVGAVDAANERAYYSNYGEALDLVAPGGNIYADLNGDGQPDGVLQQTFCNPTWDWSACSQPEPASFKYYFLHGTSMATPHVAGAAALLVATGTATSPDAVRAALETTTLDLGSAGWDQQFGHGLLQIRAALDKITGPATATPAPEPSPQVPESIPDLPYKVYLPLTLTP